MFSCASAPHLTVFSGDITSSEEECLFLHGPHGVVSPALNQGAVGGKPDSLFNLFLKYVNM